MPRANKVFRCTHSEHSSRSSGSNCDNKQRQQGARWWSLHNMASSAVAASSMAVAGAPTLDQLKQCVAAMYGPNVSNDRRRAADDWLWQFTKRPEAWQIAHALLQSVTRWLASGIHALLLCTHRCQSNTRSCWLFGYWSGREALNASCLWQP